jgi:hypothetical protein
MRFLRPAVSIRRLSPKKFRHKKFMFQMNVEKIRAGGGGLTESDLELYLTAGSYLQDNETSDYLRREISWVA